MSALVLRPDGLWQGATRWPCSIGRSGITRDKHEGDGATPAGVWRVTAMLYRPDRLAPPVSWARPIAPGDLWSDDPADPDYNLPVRAPHPFSHEEMWRADALYDLILVTDWNAARVPRRGSAIFVHEWRGPDVPTEGCIALPRAALHVIAAGLEQGAPVVVGP
ncbi:MAG: L,D-transpeptidase family protein [Rubellimicrobium sp.]|nr:L,D-transpeptidase family protein [Rubellimicrobium sp.]